MPFAQISPLGIGIVPPARNLANFAGDGGHRRFGDGARDALALERLQRRRQVHPRRDPAERRRRSQLSVPLTEKGLSIGEAVRARAVPVMLTPSCLTMSRRISLIVTRKLTWSRPRMVSELITLPVSGVPDGRDAELRRRAARGGRAPPALAFGAPPSTEVPTKPLAMSSAFCASPAEATEPDQNDRIGDRLDRDVVARQRDVEQLLKFADVAADRHFDRRDLAAVGGEGEDRRLAVGDRGDIEAARRADHGVGDLRIADEDFGGVLRQVDDDRAADAELQRLPRFRPARRR